MKKFILAFISASMLMACTGGKTGNGNDSDSTATEVDEETAFAIDSASFNKEESLDKSLPNSPKYTIHHTYQFLAGGTEASDSINATICQCFLSMKRDTDVANQLKLSGQKLAQQYIDELKQMYNPGEGDFDNMEYESEERGAFLEKSREGVLSYCMNLYVYQGGAHGGSEVFFLNFDRKTGHRITISDVLNPAFKDDIIHFMEKQLLADNKCVTREELMEKTSFLTLGELYLTENFLLEPDAITFHFGQYEVGPYAAGMLDITVPYDILKDYMVAQQ